MSTKDSPSGSGEATKPVVHLTLEERVAHGKAARRAVPRRSHADWAADATRPDPVELLQSQEVSRVDELVDLRHQRMLESPFTFYRGAAIVMANDLASTPNSHLRVQCCGDAHLANFGGFAVARPGTRVRHQRLRRDQPGPVRMGCEAARGELRDRGPITRVLGQEGPRARAADCAELPGSDDRVRGDDEPRVRGTRGSTSTRSWRALARRGDRRGGQALRGDGGQGAYQGQHEGAQQARPQGRR